MIGVRFTRPVSPHGEGDTRLLPEGVAKVLIAEGSAEPHDFPEAPHAADSVKLPEPPRAARRQVYRTKGQ